MLGGRGCCKIKEEEGKGNRKGCFSPLCSLFFLSSPRNRFGWKFVEGSFDVSSPEAVVSTGTVWLSGVSIVGDLSRQLTSRKVVF